MSNGDYFIRFLRSRGMDEAADHLEKQRMQLATLIGNVETAERQVRDMARDNDRLRIENARLKALVGEDKR